MKGTGFLAEIASRPFQKSFKIRAYKAKILSQYDYINCGLRRPFLSKLRWFVLRVAVNLSTRVKNGVSRGSLGCVLVLNILQTTCSGMISFLLAPLDKKEGKGRNENES